MSEELVFTNTPLENLRNILSEADASVQSGPAEKPVGRPAASKSEIKALIERLQRNSKRSLSTLAIREAVNSLTTQVNADGPLSAFLKNRYVADLDQRARSKS